MNLSLFFLVPQILGLECYDSNQLLDQSTSLFASYFILFFKKSFKFIVSAFNDYSLSSDHDIYYFFIIALVTI